MAETTGLAANKLAMSRALGAAFLSHQVEQLEKSVSAPPRPPPSRSGNSNNSNWRDRHRPHQPPAVDSKRTQLPVGGIRITTTHSNQQHQHEQKERPAATRKRAPHDAKKSNAKEADIIIVDASVLVNALGQVKKWCRDGQEEVIVVPLEALNTLDLLKKGSTPLAQRARTASRVLESQVGTNPRVRVQHDTAFVLWDKIAFDEDPTIASTVIPNAAAVPSSTSPSPEWVRRTICCAQWETENADATLPRIVLATLAQLSQQPQSSAVVDALQQPEPTSTSPVPLPVPHHPLQHRHELRATGTLVAYWARRARLTVLEVPPSPGTDGRVSPEDRRPFHPHHRGRGEHHPTKGGGSAMVERPPAVKAMMDVIAQPSRVVRVLARGEKLDP
ncbi:hypothetical protein F5148DRAFT_1286650 [Russula earlei]|uniref:Uncharacterized protein n=1 Tax=Russula earlei TaxID=71964 RepID=A0ACC0U4Q3_9AGAM|nr:hypothetical protein F5148DRAFT_1286650 [Russula earlei]